MMLNYRAISHTAFLLFTLLTAACGGGGGGGGGGGDNPSDPDTSTNPQPTYTISGTVSGLVNTGLALQNNGVDTLTVDGNSFEFSSAMNDGSTYEVTVSSHPDKQLCAIQNGSGTVSGGAVNDIQVVCRYWHGEELVETDDAGSAESPAIGVDAEGRVVAVWEQSDGTRSKIWATTYTPGNGWDTPIRIDDAVEGGGTSPSISVDADGSAIAVWQHLTYEGNAIKDKKYWLNTYHPDTGWGTPELTPLESPGEVRPSFAFVAQDSALALWKLGSSLWSATYSEITGWGSPVLFENNAENAAYLTFAAGGNGTVAAVWLQYDRTPYSMWANIYSGGQWGQAVPIEANAGSAYEYPDIAVDGEGNAIAVWRQSDNQRSNIWGNVYRKGGGWGTAQLLETNDTYHAYAPKVAFDSKGNAIATWYYSGAERSIAVNRYTPASGWSEAATVVTQGVSSPTLAFTPDDNALLIWSWTDSSLRSNIRATTYAKTGDWGTPQLIEGNDAGHAGAYRLVVDRTGTATAIWQQHDGTRWSIAANRFQ